MILINDKRGDDNDGIGDNDNITMIMMTMLRPICVAWVVGIMFSLPAHILSSGQWGVDDDAVVDYDEDKGEYEDVS